MSRYTEASCKICRKKGQKLFLKGYKCRTNCVVDKANDKEGKRGARPKKISDYAKHLREKQVARLSFQIGEAQFRRFFSIASKAKGKTGETLLRLLEMRLDNIVRRAGFCDSIKTARQIVSHGHVKVNGKAVNIPSYITKVEDEITLSPQILEKVIVKQAIENADKSSSRPSFISYNPETMSAKIVRLPERNEMSVAVNDQLIVEYYSK
jgi:small subunit ribosomal protein S4